ncbi:hypothetical protein [Ureibacillus chungkukjangi]|uniref:Uncharacterized protein n=1 Tax=Ureibacillus chungkukjangi TaxID=1202712 RepID=A0A318TMY3_9BACL|nr:hypothetical protein [Ureibacillus chungkukjangi]PYF06106.1 hypothetical protein BJ095_11267 [Ureibacillus chungkukjangi]
MAKNRILFLSCYGIALILLLYFGLNSLFVSILNETFPNVNFIIVLLLLIIVSFSIGLGIRQYINSFTKDKRNKMKNFIFGITLFSWLIVLGMFWVI